MPNISTFLKDKLLDKAVGAINFTPSATLYIRLFSTVLTAAGAGTELANPSYAAKAIDNNLTVFPLSAGGLKSNAVRFDFAVAAENWSVIRAVGLFDAATGGNLYFYDNLTTPLTISSGENLFFDVGDFDFELS